MRVWVNERERKWVVLVDIFVLYVKLFPIVWAPGVTCIYCCPVALWYHSRDVLSALARACRPASPPGVPAPSLAAHPSREPPTHPLLIPPLFASFIPIHSFPFVFIHSFIPIHSFHFSPHFSLPFGSFYKKVNVIKIRELICDFWLPSFSQCLSHPDPLPKDFVITQPNAVAKSAPTTCLVEVYTHPLNLIIFLS